MGAPACLLPGLPMNARVFLQYWSAPVPGLMRGLGDWISQLSHLGDTN